jgi:hypothetical protein
MDKYDEAVAFFTENPKQKERFWANPDKEGPGCLFQFCNKANYPAYLGGDKSIGCITMIISSEKYLAETPELTAAIRADRDNLPDDITETTPIEKLVRLGEWQRKIDQILGRS